MVKFSIKKIVGSIIFLCCICTVANAANMIPIYAITFTNDTLDSNPQCMGYTVSVMPTNGSSPGNVSSNQSVEIDYTDALYNLVVNIHQNPGKCESSPSNWATTATFTIDIANQSFTAQGCTGTACKAIKVSPTSDQGFQFILSNS